MTGTEDCEGHTGFVDRRYKITQGHKFQQAYRDDEQVYDQRRITEPLFSWRYFDCPLETIWHLWFPPEATWRGGALPTMWGRCRDRVETWKPWKPLFEVSS